MYFLTHIEPLHPQQGKEALIVIREQDRENNVFRSHVRVQDLSHSFYTPNLPPAEAERLLEELRGKPELSHLLLETVPYNTNKSFLRATGSKEDKKVLPPPFLCKPTTASWRDPIGLNAPARLLRWHYPPGLIVPSSDAPLEELSYSKYVSLEDVVNDTHATLDIEVEGWETGQDRIFMVVYRSPQHHVLFHDLPFDDNMMEDCSLVRFSSPEDLGERLTRIIQEDDPLWLFGHNIMNFDQIKIRDLTGTYAPAVNRHYPVTKSAQGVGKVITKGRWTIDTYAYHQNYRNLFGNNRLERIAQVKKSLTYPEQARLVRTARKEKDEAAFQQLAAYCIQDGSMTENEALHLREVIALKAIHFRREPDSICTTGKNTLAQEYWKRRHFRIKKTFDDSWQYRRSTDTPLAIDDYLRPLLSQPKHQRGCFDDVAVMYLTPVIAASSLVLQKRVPELLARYECSTNILEKFDLLQTMNAELSFLVGEMNTIFGQTGQTIMSPPDQLTPRQQAAFYCLFTYHGLRGIDGEAYAAGIREEIARTNDILQQLAVINQGKQLNFIQGEVPEIITESYRGLILGRGRTISFRQGKVVSDPFATVSSDVPQYVYQDFSLNKGKKTNFERRVIREWVHQVMRGEPLTTVHCWLQSEMQQLGEGKCSPEDYLVPVKRRSYFRDVLESALLNSDMSDDAKARYTALRKRIGDRFSDEAQRELKHIIELCQGTFAHPYLEEFAEEVLKSYPPIIPCVYVSEGRGMLLPRSMTTPDVAVYREKVEKRFRDFFSLSRDDRQRQLSLFSAGR